MVGRHKNKGVVKDKMFSKKHGEELLECPRCETKMRKIKKHDVILDVCKTCNGMWLDDNEINKLIALTNGKK
jgi:uncharacterized C2H2 Zn-finger protein